MAFELLVLFSALYVVTHVGLASDPVKRFLVKKLGEKAHGGIFSLSALLTLGGSIFIYVRYDAAGPLLWHRADWMYPVMYVLMLFSLLFIALSFGNPSPVGMAPGVKPEARGILRVTAHPQNMGFVFFGLAHVLATGTAGGAALYGSFAALGLLGAFHQTAKKRKDRDPAVQSFLNETGVIPFAAIIRGKNKFVPGEFKFKFILIGTILYAAAIAIHWLLNRRMFM